MRLREPAGLAPISVVVLPLSKKPSDTDACTVSKRAAKN